MPVGGGDGDGVDRSGAGEALDQMVVGDDVAVRRDDEARAQRPGFASARLTAAPAPAAAVIAALRCVGIEPAEEILERVGLRFDRHALLGRNVDDRGLQLGDEVGERHRRAGTRRECRRSGRVLRNLSARLPRGERECGSPQEQGHRDPIGVTHGSGLLRSHRYSINWLAIQAPNRVHPLIASRGECRLNAWRYLARPVNSFR